MGLGLRRELLLKAVYFSREESATSLSQLLKTESHLSKFVAER